MGCALLTGDQTWLFRLSGAPPCCNEKFLPAGRGTTNNGGDEPAPYRDIPRVLHQRFGQRRRPRAQYFAAVGVEDAAPRRIDPRLSAVRTLGRIGSASCRDRVCQYV